MGVPTASSQERRCAAMNGYRGAQSVQLQQHEPVLATLLYKSTATGHAWVGWRRSSRREQGIAKSASKTLASPKVRSQWQTSSPNLPSSRPPSGCCNDDTSGSNESFTLAENQTGSKKSKR